MADEFEVVELEYSEDDILYYLVDENDEEIGFVIMEDGQEVECYYEGFDGDDYEFAEESPVEATEPAPAPEPEPYVAEKAADHGYLHKLAAIASHEGGKARDKAEAKLDVARGKAEVKLDKAKQAATEQAGKAKQVATEQAARAKAKADESDIDLTREGLKETTADLNAIAKEGAETAKELKEAYDDIMENFGFLVPKKVCRKLP